MAFPDSLSSLLQAFFVPEPAPTKAETESARLLGEIAKDPLAARQHHQQFAIPDKSRREESTKSLCYALPEPIEVAQEA